MRDHADEHVRVDGAGGELVGTGGPGGVSDKDRETGE
jgi:hypothetical protein